jgi:putative ABC transport system permease protein
MGTFIQDLKYGVRMLAKNPGFTAIAVITLALGIGANTAIFSVVNGVLLNPMPYQQPDCLVALYSKTPEFDRSSISYPNFLDWVRENHSFSALAAYRHDNFSLTGMGEPERLSAQMISAAFFPVLGVQPAVGRMLRPDEDQLGSSPVVLISEGFWKRKFGSSPDAIGMSLTLDGKGYTVIGVIPAKFYFYGFNWAPSDVYVPIGQWNDPMFRDRRVGMGMDAVGRLKPGVTFEQAKADMQTIARHLAEEYPDVNTGTGVSLFPLKQDVVGEIRPFLLVLLASVGFVLLISCVNVANLLLARSTGRTREFAIRTALGAGRGRVVRQLLTESALLALAGGGLGLLAASWGLQGALKALPAALPRGEEITLDGRVLLFTLVASMLAGMLFGLTPALKTSQPDLHETLKEGGRGSSAPRHRVQSAFVIVEMALALVLLAGAGLMIRSLSKLWGVDPGFDPHNVSVFHVQMPVQGQAPDAVRASWRAILEKLQAIPGVQAVSMSAGAVPLQGDSEVPFWLEGEPKPTSQTAMKWSLFYIVQPDYLKVMGIPLRRGRFITSADNEHARFVAVIDERFARMAFGDQDPIGRVIHFDIMNAAAEIVGVVGHVNQWGLDADSTSAIQAQCYFSVYQTPDQLVPLLGGGGTYVLRTAGSPPNLLASIREAFGQVSGQATVFNNETMEDVISNSLATRRFSMVLLGAFAGLALLMSCVGIYGVISYLAGQRTHEIGIRMALGAKRSDVLGMVLGEAAKLALVGIALGLVAAAILTRLMASMLFGVSARDPLTFTGVALLLALVALAACYIPARRATKVDPLDALRYE